MNFCNVFQFYGVPDDLYQKNARFEIFFSICGTVSRVLIASIY